MHKTIAQNCNQTQRILKASRAEEPQPTYRTKSSLNEHTS